MITAEDTPATFAIPVSASPTSVALTVVSGPSHGTLTGSGPSWTYTPALNYNGADLVVVNGQDSRGSATATVTISVTAVNDAPVVLTTGTAVTYVENATAVAIDPEVTVADPDGATLTGATVQLTTGCTDPLAVLGLASPPAGITVTGYVAVTCTLTLTGAVSIATYQEALRLVTYVSTSDDPSGDARVARFTVDDGEAANHTGSADRALSVTPVDDAPVAVNDSITVNEDAAAEAITVLGNDTDVDAGPKSISAVTQPPHGTVAITGDGTGLAYAPTANFCNTVDAFAAEIFTYTLTPGGSTATVALTVTCADDPPIAFDDFPTVNEHTTTSFSVLANDTDGDGGPKLIASATQPSNGTTVVAPDRLSVAYTPNGNYCNQTPNQPADTFTYALNGGSSATVSVTVTCACGENKRTDFVVGSN